MQALFIFVDEAVTETGSEDQSTSQHEASQWLETVNRGGLVIVSDIVYDLFLSIELELRKHFSVANASTINDSLKELAFKQISENEDVLFYWDIIAVNWESTEAKELLHIIINQFITVRGFSFASGFMEMYKQSKHKSTQKAKGLRKTLDSTRVCHDD